eukprot:Gb_03059 [translate_table: standard]
MSRHPDLSILRGCAPFPSSNLVFALLSLYLFRTLIHDALCLCLSLAFLFHVAAKRSDVPENFVFLP